MKNIKSTSIALATVTALGLGLIASNADAQGRNGYRNYGNQNSYSQHRGYNPSVNHHSRHNHGQRDILGRDVMMIDQLAKGMTAQFAQELRYRRGCRQSIALLNHMRSFSAKTCSLTQAYRGSCPVTFKKAACAVRDSLTCVERQAARVPGLSCSVKSMIDQSCPIATRIHNNSSQFRPVGSFTHSTPPRGNSHATSGRGGYSNQSPYASIITSLLSRAFR